MLIALASVYNNANPFVHFFTSFTLMSKPLDIKISTVVAVSAILHDTDLTVLDTALQQMTGGTPDFFEDEFAVIDIGDLGDKAAKINWKKLVALFKKYRLNTVAVRNVPENLHDKIAKEGLSIDSMAKPPELPAEEETAPKPAQAELKIDVPPPPPPVVKTETKTVIQQVSVPTMIVDTPVRAGQRVYAKGADLVVMAAVNNGAEVIADGSIHIYAPLRGRALAGASGNTEARIFTTSLAAELVSIAGVYQTFEDGYPDDVAKKSVQIRLDGEHIDITPLQIVV